MQKPAFDNRRSLLVALRWSIFDDRPSLLVALRNPMLNIRLSLLVALRWLIFDNRPTLLVALRWPIFDNRPSLLLALRIECKLEDAALRHVPLEYFMSMMSHHDGTLGKSIHPNPVVQIPRWTS